MKASDLRDRIEALMVEARSVLQRENPVDRMTSGERRKRILELVLKARPLPEGVSGHAAIAAHLAGTWTALQERYGLRVGPPEEVAALAAAQARELCDAAGPRRIWDSYAGRLVVDRAQFPGTET